MERLDGEGRLGWRGLDGEGESGMVRRGWDGEGMVDGEGRVGR